MTRVVINSLFCQLTPNIHISQIRARKKNTLPNKKTGVEQHESMNFTLACSSLNRTSLRTETVKHPENSFLSAKNNNSYRKSIVVIDYLRQHVSAYYRYFSQQRMEWLLLTYI